jgi:exonuclease III
MRRRGFPRLEIEALGYNVVTHGQKTFNGVALLSKLPFDETKSGWPATTRTPTPGSSKAW